MRGWILGLTIAAGCAGHAHRRAPRPTGLAPSRTATVIAPVAIAPVVTAPEARAPLAMAPIAPRPIEGVAALALGDRAVVRALNQAQPSFLRCFRRALRIDPGLVRATVTVLGRVSPAGQLEDARADAPTAAFGACVIAVARAMRFERTAAPTSIVVPLRFAAP